MLSCNKTAVVDYQLTIFLAVFSSENVRTLLDFGFGSESNSEDLQIHHLRIAYGSMRSYSSNVRSLQEKLAVAYFMIIQLKT